MATTLEIVDATVERLKTLYGQQVAVEYFPEQPADYRLNHPRGALLVAFPGSRYGRSVDVGAVAQPRELMLSVAVVLRQLNGRDGALAWLDKVRTALVGWRLPDCRKARAVREAFLGAKAGQWQYVVDVAAETMVVEEMPESTEPLLTQVTYEENDE